jgi:hypothetical protein
MKTVLEPENGVYVYYHGRGIQLAETQDFSIHLIPYLQKCLRSALYIMPALGLGLLPKLLPSINISLHLM